MKDISICASKTPSGHVPGRSSISREEQRRRSLAFLAARDDERRPVPLLDEDWDELVEHEGLLGYARSTH